MIGQRKTAVKFNNNETRVTRQRFPNNEWNISEIQLFD